MSISTLKRFFQENDHFIITAHEAPDADAIGAVMALSTVLQRMEKTLLCGFAESVPGKYLFMDPDNLIKQFKDPVHSAFSIDSFHLIVLDTIPSNIGKMSAFRDSPNCQSVITIDHHDIPIPQSQLNWQNAEASSTCEMIYDLLESMDVPLDFEISQALFSGIVYDTGSFMYPKTTEKTFSIARHLVSMEVDPNRIFSNLFQSKSVASLLLQSKVLNSLELYFQDKIAIQIMPAIFLKETGAVYEESQEIINIPLQSLNIIVSVFLKENEEGQRRCSLRSKGQIDCASIARSFGGGGHKTAAGFKFSESFESIRDKLLDIFGPMLP